MKTSLAFSLLAALLFSLNVFAEGEGPCHGDQPQEVPSATPSAPSVPSTPSGPSGGHVSTPPSGSPSTVGDQLGSTFDPSAKGNSGGDDNLFDPKDITFGKNPLDHNLVRQYLKSVDKMIASKKEEIKQRETWQREDRQKLTRMKERIETHKDFIDKKLLRDWGETMSRQQNARHRIDDLTKSFQENYDRKQELDAAKKDAVQDRDRWDKIHEELRDLEKQHSKLEMDMMDAVQERDRADAGMKAADRSLQWGYENLKEQVKEYDQFKRDVGAGSSDIQNASIPSPGR